MNKTEWDSFWKWFILCAKSYNHQINDSDKTFYFQELGNFDLLTVKKAFSQALESEPNFLPKVFRIKKIAETIQSSNGKSYKPLEPLDAIRAREEREYQQRLFTYKKELVEIKDFLLNNAPLSDRLREASKAAEECCMNLFSKEIKYEYQQFTGKHTGHICAFEGLVCEYLEGSWRPQPLKIKGNLGEKIPKFS